jgi:bacterioferritin
MKGNESIIEQLNVRLSEELAAIHQYIAHAAMQENWGYGKLSKITLERAQAEMKHAGLLMDHILFLEGEPDVETLAPIIIGKDVKDQINKDVAAEEEAIQNYNASIVLATRELDDGSRSVFEANLKEEEEHLNYLEGQQDLIEQMGIQQFLSQMIE